LETAVVELVVDETPKEALDEDTLCEVDVEAVVETEVVVSTYSAKVAVPVVGLYVISPYNCVKGIAEAAVVVFASFVPNPPSQQVALSVPQQKDPSSQSVTRGFDVSFHRHKLGNPIRSFCVLTCTHMNTFRRSPSFICAAISIIRITPRNTYSFSGASVEILDVAAHAHCARI